MKKIRIITAGLIAAALSLTAVSGAQAYPPGVDSRLVVTGGLDVDGKPHVAYISTTAGTAITVKLNGVKIASGTATGSRFSIPTKWTKPGIYTLSAYVNGAYQTAHLFYPTIVFPRPGTQRASVSATMGLRTTSPGTLFGLKVNGKVVLRPKMIGTSGAYQIKVAKKYLKKGKNVVVYTIGATKITKYLTAA